MFLINPYINFGLYNWYSNYVNTPEIQESACSHDDKLPVRKYTTCKYDEFGNLVFLTFDANTGELLEKYVTKARHNYL